MSLFLAALRQFFAREAEPQLIPIPVPHLNHAGQHELYYAELMERGWAPKPRDYSWPNG